MLRPLLLALGLLTTLPVPGVVDPKEREIGLSVLLYPLVGVIVGFFVWGLAMVTVSWPENMRGVFILFLWLALTGGLHLEGLGDLADAWVGGMGRPGRMLEIMKDPRCGPAAVMAITMQLLFKWVAIQALVQQRHEFLLFFAPVVGRTVLLPLMLSTPYLRKEGMATVAIAAVPKTTAWMVVALVGTSLTVKIPLAVGATVVCLVWFRWLMLRHLGGVTGDVLGAGCELSETIFLLAALLLPNL
ncbi:MAG: cobalamin synthase [Magnetococcales bacterium]|nr:cobalamin synthase [Magnetococcales bacterium]